MHLIYNVNYLQCLVLQNNTRTFTVIDLIKAPCDINNVNFFQVFIEKIKKLVSLSSGGGIEVPNMRRGSRKFI